jgi:YVTN family beta-propeller protein
MVVLWAVAAGLVLALGGCGGEKDTGTAIATSGEPTVVARIAVGNNPCLAAPVGEEVWVSVYSDAQLVRVDPETNEVVGEPIDVGAGPCGLAVAQGSVWVMTYDDDTIERVDLEKRAVTKRVPVKVDPWDIQFSDGTLWVSNNIDGTVTRHDPRSGKPVATIETGESPANITLAYGSVWVGSTSGTTVFRIDPETNEVTELESGGTEPGSVEAAAGDIWVSNRGSNTVTRLDPETGEQLAEIPVGTNPIWLAAAEDGTLLVPNNGGNTVSRVDPATNRVVATIKVANRPAVIRPAFGDLWLTHLQDDELWRLRVPPARVVPKRFLDLRSGSTERSAVGFGVASSHDWPMQAEKATEVTAAPRARDERLRVRRWRREQFLGLGFSLSDSAALARSSADLQEARTLIACGCSHPTAFRIMR